MCWKKEKGDLDAYDYQKYDKYEVEVECSKCHGYGFILLDMDGNIVIPKVKRGE